MRFQRGREYDFVPERGNLESGMGSGIRTHSWSKRTWTFGESSGSEREVLEEKVEGADEDGEMSAGESEGLYGKKIGDAPAQGRRSRRFPGDGLAMRSGAASLF